MVFLFWFLSVFGVVPGEGEVAVSLERLGVWLTVLVVASVGASVGVGVTPTALLALAQERSKRMGVPWPLTNPGLLAEGLKEGAEVALAVVDE